MTPSVKQEAENWLIKMIDNATQRLEYGVGPEYIIAMRSRIAAYKQTLHFIQSRPPFIAGYEFGQRWIDIKVQQPIAYEQVIGFFPEGVEGSRSRPAVHTAHWTGKKLVSDFPNSTAHYFEATMWQPMPPPPAERKEEK